MIFDHRRGRTFLRSTPSGARDGSVKLRKQDQGGRKMGLRSITCGLRLCLNVFFFHLRILFPSVHLLRSLSPLCLGRACPPSSFCGWRCLRVLGCLSAMSGRIPAGFVRGIEAARSSRERWHRTHLYHSVRCSVQGYSHIASPASPGKSRRCSAVVFSPFGRCVRRLYTYLTCERGLRNVCLKPR